MDLFTVALFMSILDLEIQAREIENDNLLIPNWLFRQSSNPIRQQVDRIERRPDSQSQTEDLPIIPDWMFQENSIQNNRIYTGGIRNNFELSNFFQSILNDRRPTQRAVIYEREFGYLSGRRCWCGMCNLMEPVKITETKEKLIETGKNDECPITYDPINYGDAYLCCSECKYNFSEQAILKHLNGNSMKKECPMCRSEWKDYCKYINKDSLREKQEELQQWLTLPKNNINLIDIKMQNNKDVYSLLSGNINKTRHNKKWFYGK